MEEKSGEEVQQYEASRNNTIIVRCITACQCSKEFKMTYEWVYNNPVMFLPLINYQYHYEFDYIKTRKFERASIKDGIATYLEVL